MNYLPFNFVGSGLHGDFMNEPSDAELDAELTRDESGAKNNSENATDQHSQGLFGRLADRAFARSDSSAAVHEPHQIDSKPKVNTLQDLEVLMDDAPHFSLREGIEANFDSSHLGSAVLFEASKIDSGPSGATRVRYLPLVNKGAKTTPKTSSETVATPPARRLQRYPRHAPSTGSPPAKQTHPPLAHLSKNRQLDISPDAKRYIDRARAPRSLDGVATTNSAATFDTSQGHHLPSTSTTIPAPTGQWPPGRVPVELFETITDTLSHRDIRNMRLVCKEFEAKTSGALFKEVVVPFTAELYDMIEDDVSARLSDRPKPGSIQQNVARAAAPQIPHLYQANGDSTYYRKAGDAATRHGLRVFDGFGPHMNKFGIRLEVTEADLSMANLKSNNVKYVEAYHGGYSWPPPGYARFSRLAGIEKIADETPRMTEALAKLINVREIGLSLDSGLGILGGPDRSHHDMIFDRSAAVFEGSDLTQRPTSNGVEQLWSYLQQSHNSFTTDVRLSQERLMACILTWGRDESVKLPTVASATEYDDSTLWPCFETDGIFTGVDLSTPIFGVMYTTSADMNIHNTRASLPPLSPATLTSEQNQWILETGWAQSAFLDTYVLALGDNPQVFYQITKVTISKISSGLLSKLDRDAFWDALPSAKDVTLLVSPDWRVVDKDEAGCAVTNSIAPSLAVSTFLAVIRRITVLEEIKRLRIGYTQGGENAKGMFGRNNNLMPAPIAALDQVLQPDPEILAFDHVEDMTLVNCWITPQALLQLASRRTIAAVTGKALTLESVSMTASLKLELQNYLQVSIATRQQFRQGCWPWVIEDLRSFLQPVPHEPDPYSMEPPELQFSPAPYKKITFASCGYTVLPNQALMDQSAIELGPTMNPAHFTLDHGNNNSEWFRHRAEKLRPYMQSSNDSYIGRIVPWMNHREIAALRMWKMRVGLPPGEGQDAECDGFPTRGTGRFWGDVQKDCDTELAGSDKGL
ncbi:hypothetical protein Q7P35_001581 [Cladosporium inversicolor]